jgi:hypothetical protein
MEYSKPEGRWHRLIPSHFPSINVFDDIFDSVEEQEIAFEIEAMTNDRLRHEVGDLHIVPKEDRIFGDGATPIMAAFTHLGRDSRFTTGDLYGVYYAAEDVETAVKETMHHTARFLAATHEGDTELTMRCYVTRVQKSLVDISNGQYPELHNLDDYNASQKFGETCRDNGEYGIQYQSVRSEGKKNIAILRPPAITKCVQAAHYRYQWSGLKQAFTGYFKITNMHTVHVSS